MKGGAEAQLSIRALPAASPGRRSIDKHIHAGNSPSAASRPRDVWLLSTPQIALKDFSRTDPACSSDLSCQTNTRQEGRLLGKTQLWLFSFGLLWRLNSSCFGSEHAPLSGPSAFMRLQPALGCSPPPTPAYRSDIIVPRREG